MSWARLSADSSLARTLRARRDVKRSSGFDEHLRDTVPFSEAAARSFPISAIVFVLLSFLFVSGALYYAQYSGALRWLFFSLLVMLLGFLSVRVVARSARDPVGDRVEGGRSGIGGDLRSLKVTLARADAGLAYSQLLFADRMRRAFLEKVRTARELPPGTVEAISRDPDRLATLLGDDEIAEFVYETSVRGRAYPSNSERLVRHPNFAARVERLLERMEAWQ